MNSDCLPIDLITEILWRLPAKSITRFYCVSKLWASVLRGPYFTELFLTRSSAQPRILFSIQDKNVWSFFSIPQHLSTYEKSSSSLVVAAKFHMKFRVSYHIDRRICGYAEGLIYIYFYGKSIKEDIYDGVPVICNPNTGQYATLPYLLKYRMCNSFFGFDPIDKQFKVLFMAYPGFSDDHKILTLETGTKRWREIKCPLTHFPVGDGICIDGVIYYLGECRRRGDETYVIVCFDVRSEKFKFVYMESFCRLINYKGKLCVIYWEDNGLYWKKEFNCAIKLGVWVLEDAEEHKWSEHAYTLWDDKFFVNEEYTSVCVTGVTTMGEIILSMGYYTCKQPFFVFYFNPEKNTLRSVEIQGFGNYCHEACKQHCVYTFANHVEDLNVNNSKILNSSIYGTYMKKKNQNKKRKKKKKNHKNEKKKKIETMS